MRWSLFVVQVDAEIMMFSKLTGHHNICSLIDHEINDQKGVIFLVSIHIHVL